MNILVGEIKKKLPFFIVLFLILISGVIWLLISGKGACFLALNTYHSFLLDQFFIRFTYVGDGIFAIVLSLLYLIWFRSNKIGWMLLYAFFLSGLIAQIFKNIFPSPRPRLFFEHVNILSFIDGVTLSNNSSFPSGHTTTAFAVATVLVLVLKNTRWQLVILFVAMCVGYSRIYLGQHFLGDVLAGMFIGTASGLICVAGVANNKIKTFSFKKAKDSNAINPPKEVLISSC